MVDAVIFVIVIILMILALKASLKHFRGQGSCCSSGSATTAVPMKRLDTPTSRRTLTIDGMHCSHCCDRVHRALDGISGAAVESISWRDGKVLLATEREIEDELIRRVVEKEGYKLVKSE